MVRMAYRGSRKTPVRLTLESEALKVPVCFENWTPPPSEKSPGGMLTRTCNSPPGAALSPKFSKDGPLMVVTRTDACTDTVCRDWAAPGPAAITAATPTSSKVLVTMVPRSLG